MRLSNLRKDDLPQPEGPMMAVMLQVGMSRVMLRSAWKSP
jgi:hypothetical protein